MDLNTYAILFLVNAAFLAIGFFMGRSTVKVFPVADPPEPKVVKIKRETKPLALADEDPFKDALDGVNEEKRIETVGVR